MDLYTLAISVHQARLREAEQRRLYQQLPRRAPRLPKPRLRLGDLLIAFGNLLKAVRLMPSTKPSQTYRASSGLDMPNLNMPNLDMSGLNTSSGSNGGRELVTHHPRFFRLFR